MKCVISNARIKLYYVVHISIHAFIRNNFHLSIIRNDHRKLLSPVNSERKKLWFEISDKAFNFLTRRYGRHTRVLNIIIIITRHHGITTPCTWCVFIFFPRIPVKTIMCHFFLLFRTSYNPCYAKLRVPS